jgi:hypothetical protein
MPTLKTEASTVTPTHACGKRGENREEGRGGDRCEEEEQGRGMKGHTASVVAASANQRERLLDSLGTTEEREGMGLKRRGQTEEESNEAQDDISGVGSRGKLEKQRVQQEGRVEGGRWRECGRREPATGSTGKQREEESDGGKERANQKREKNRTERRGGERVSE